MATMEVGFPFRLDSGGRVESPDYDGHIEDLIEQVLFTSPGERVNRPDFGAGLLSTIFASLSHEELTAVQFIVQSSLIKWLGHLIEVSKVFVQTPEAATLQVTIEYKVLRNRQSRISTFQYRQTA